jgi:hypothetical protein
MPRVNRSEICADDEVQVFQLVNRCVRRTFLCGVDPVRTQTPPVPAAHRFENRCHPDASSRRARLCRPESEAIVGECPAQPDLLHSSSQRSVMATFSSRQLLLEHLWFERA